MAVYDIFESKKQEEVKKVSSRDRFFAAFTARMLFFILFVADCLWIVYAIALFTTATLLSFVTWFRWPLMIYVMKKQWVSIKRAAVCGLSLFVALFSPPLGIMVACTYFLMYDKSGIEEVVPASLQEQFQEFVK